MDEVIQSKPDVLGGTPCFQGTRVPVRSLFDYLEGGYTVDYFLSQFPSVRREQVSKVLGIAYDRSVSPETAAHVA